MSNEAEALLMTTLSESEQNTDTRIMLVVDEPTRSIKYETELILGVAGDRFAERVYLKCPQYVHDDSHSIDLSLATTKIYINYQNAENEPYIEECYKEGMLADGTFMFSWLISDYVTVKKGKVIFNVCVKDESSTLTDYSGRVLIPEWHTTTYEGTILPAVDVTEKTPEVLTSDTITSAAIIEAMNDCKNEVAALEQTLADTDEYINERIETNVIPIVNQLNNKIDGISDDVATTDNTIGVRYLGTYPNTYFETSNDYLDEETTPGVYSFHVEENGNKVSYILIVDESLGYVIQTVLGSLTNDDRYATSRYKLFGATTWNYGNVKRNFAYKDQIGVTHLGTYTSNPFDTNDDYLAPTTTPGIYSFVKYVYPGSTKIPYILVVSENGSTIYQTVFKNLDTGDMMYSRRYLDRAVSETNWTVLNDSYMATYKYVHDNFVEKDSLYLHNIYFHASGGVEADVYLQVLSNKSTSYNINGTDQNSLLVHLMSNGYLDLVTCHPATGRYGGGVPVVGIYAAGSTFYFVYISQSTAGDCVASSPWSTSTVTEFTDRVIKLV